MRYRSRLRWQQLPRLALLTLVFVSVAFTRDWAQTPDQVIVARSSTPQLDAKTVQIIAEKFQTFALPGRVMRLLPILTVDEVITQLCGSVNPDYYAEFVLMNKPATIDRAAYVGPSGATLKWPACLNITMLPAPPAKPVATSANPFQAVNGSTVAPVGGSKSTMSASLQNPVPFESSPVELRPIPGLSLDDAVTLLKATNSVAVSTPTPSISGRIVEDVDLNEIDQNTPQAKSCPAVALAFDASAVANAYRWSRSSRVTGAKGGTASIFVVDNGFFGADPNNAAAEFAPSFPKGLFGDWVSTPSVVGPVTEFGEKPIYPDNYQGTFAEGFKPDKIQGHGTHVAGLAIGGPSLVDFRDKELLSPSAMIRLTIINIGAGKPDLIKRSDTYIYNLLNEAPSGGPVSSPDPRIVNLSVTYDGNQSLGLFQKLFDKSPTDLFVLAAGNDHHDVGLKDIFPADLGGMPNVLTVAANDVAGGLSYFSNFGASAVGLAAPGCGIASWVDASNQARLSGTSQATPIVTFAAALLRTLDDALSPQQIKWRLFSTGDLLEGGLVRWNVISGSRLNIPEALFLYDDILEVRNPNKPTEIWLGQIESLYGFRCTGGDRNDAQGYDTTAIYAYKSDGKDNELLYGRDVQTPARCVATLEGDGNTVPAPYVKFKRTARLVGNVIVRELDAESIIYISRIAKMVPRGPYNDFP